MVRLPNLELKAERYELLRLMCAPFGDHPGYQNTKADFTQFVHQMGNRKVLDCLTAMKG